MSRFVDAILVYRILRKLATPFEETEAFKLGIIDAQGKILRKFADLNTPTERDAYTLLDRLVWRLQRIINRNPFEKSKLASFATAMALVKEHCDGQTEPLPSEFEARLLALNENTEIETWALEATQNFFEGRHIDGRSTISFKMHAEEMAVGGGFSGQATPNPNPNLAGKDMLLGKMQRRKKTNVK